MCRRGRMRLGASVVALVLVAAGGVAAEVEKVEAAAEPEAVEESSESDRIDEVERKVETVAGELSRALLAATVPETKELESAFGLGPAASKVYFREKGLAIASYGEVRFQANLDTSEGVEDNIFDLLRLVLYVGYRFNDRFVVNSELEFEHAGTGGGGSVSAEFLNIDFFATENIGVRAGLVLIPMGFINEIHEPSFYFGSERPEVERQIIPSTWRENGAGVFGTLFDRVHFRMYAVNGFQASGFSVAGLRGGRQKGSRAIANDWAFVGRGDVDVAKGLSLGGSIYVGNSGQDETLKRDVTPPIAPGTPVFAPELKPFNIPATLTTLYEVHAEYKAYGISSRALLTQAFLQDTAALNAALGNTAMSGRSIAKQMFGAYWELGYDVLPLVLPETKMSLEPFFRYERLDTQHEMAGSAVKNLKYVQDIYTVGAIYKPIPEIVLKFDYRNIRPRSDADDIADQIQVSVGYVF